MPAGSRQNNSGEEGTILLRTPQPKYNIQGKKLPKENLNNQTIPDEECKQNLPGAYITNTGGKPMAVVGASYQGKAISTEERLAHHYSADHDHLNNSTSMPNLQSMGARDSVKKDMNSVSKDETSNKNILSSTDEQNWFSLSAMPKPSSVTNLPSLLGSSGIGDPSSGTSTPMTTQVLKNVQSHFEQTERIKQLEQEKERLSRDLDVQLQVNGELKKLLVASVGEDLSHRMEKLARDRAELTQDLGGFNKKMDEDYENFDKVSIQADMWRSKYLASRVMVEELGNARAYYALQLHDGHDALQQLLNERHELRTNLLENYKVMQQLKNAFDPLNMQRSTTLASTNILDLSRACQQLSEAMRFRLLPANIAVSIGMEGHGDIWQNCVTRAEQFAHEVLSRPSEPSGSLASGSSRLLPIAYPSVQPINRFHPNQRHENLTFNCTKCKGEITVL